MHFEILNPVQREIFSKLSFVKNLKLYLAGGTALSLQLGHRTSVDFDFYTKNHFKSGELLKHFKKHLKGYSLKVLRDQDDTFEIQLNGVHLSCFHYAYKLLVKPLKAEHLDLAAIEDISAMKIVAISQRGRRRDFIDIYYLIKKFGLTDIFSLTQKKYPEFDIYNGLRGLVYFEDADKDSEVARIKTFEKINWQEVKNYIKGEVIKFQKSH